MTDLNSLALFAKVVEAASFPESARRLKNADLHRQPPHRRA